MAYIGPLPAETFTSFATQEFSTSATTSYTLDHAVTNENEIALFINNVRQQPGSGKAYTATGTALTLSEATASTDTMYAVFLGRALQTVNPAGGSVGSSQIAAEMITGQTALAATPADTDELLISDAGVLKRIDYSYIKSNPTHVLLSTTTISANTASVSFGSTIITSTYKNYMVTFTNITLDAAQNILLKISSDNGSNYKSAAQHAFAVSGYDSSNNEERESDGGSSSGFFLLPNELTTATKRACSFTMYINDPFDNSKHFTYHTHGVSHDDASKTVTFTGAGEYTADESDQFNAIQFIPVSGNFDEGIIKVYGVN